MAHVARNWLPRISCSTVDPIIGTELTKQIPTGSACKEPRLTNPTMLDSNAYAQSLFCGKKA